MNTVLSLIYLIEMNSLDNSIAKTIANYIIDNIEEIEKQNVQTVAKNTYTSTTSVIKFCQTLGFETYNGLKNKLLITNKARREQLDEKIKKQTIDLLLDKIQYFTNEKIEKELFLNTIDSIVDLINQKQRIYFYGCVFPMNLSQAFGEDMTMMGIPTHFVQIKNESNKLEYKAGLHILVTFSGRFIELNKSDYYKILDFKKSNVLISQESKEIGDIYVNIAMPKTDSVDFDDIIFLLILDMIKLKYYQKYYKPLKTNG